MHLVDLTSGSLVTHVATNSFVLLPAAHIVGSRVNAFIAIFILWFLILPTVIFVFVIHCLMGSMPWHAFSWGFG